MKGFAWGGGAVLFLSIAGAWPGVSGTLDVLARAWWVIPLLASLGSLMALEGYLIFRCLGRTRGSAIPTAAYLISGPSVAAFNLSAFLPRSIPPPPWVGSLMLALLLGSAWAYYLSSGEQGDDQRRTEAQPPFQLSSA